MIPGPYRALAAIIAAGLVVLAIASSYAWTFSRGEAKAQAACNAAELQQTVTNQQQQIAELETARAMSQQAAQEAQLRADNLQQEKKDAAKNSEKLAACLRDGTCRVRDKFTCPAPSVRHDPDAAAGNAEEARTGLTATHVGVLDGIARDGDDAVRELNSCIDQLHADRALLEAARDK